MSSYFPPPEQCSRHAIFPGVQIQTCAGEKMMVSVVDLAPHSVVEEHAHPHEQVGMLLSGKVIFFIGDEQKTLTAGDVWIIPRRVNHTATALLQPAHAFPPFIPLRQPYP